ncbi:prostate and testis expressed protein 3-like [Heteronotia binoei]|uniref:prostate and testis expressed protein 3-like n=1 Tax=Heteronotia binoei TaxID=13085 RepID=UPI00292DEF92|nr:prostate and testis expressed protein 3-like [Heteronotia binoei]
MKIQMNDILALCFLMMLSIEIAGGVKCLGCTDVGPDNKCKRKSYECTIGAWRFCFMQKFSKSNKIVYIKRGCTSFCKTETRIRSRYRLKTWCCYFDYCNSLNVWY